MIVKDANFRHVIRFSELFESNAISAKALGWVDYTQNQGIFVDLSSNLSSKKVPSNIVIFWEGVLAPYHAPVYATGI